MRISSHLATLMAVAAVPATLCAEVTNNVFGVGGDVVLRRNNTIENDGFLRIKTQSGDTETSGNDRIGLLKFDLSGLTEGVSESILRLELPRGVSSGHPSNNFDAGDQLFLYGIPNGGAEENFDEATVSFATFPYFTGGGSVVDPRPASDTTANGINDEVAILLDTFLFDEPSDAFDLVNFQSPELTAFLQADTNDIATFILGVSQTDPFKTAVFVSDTGTEGTPLPPTLLTNDDVPLMGTDFNMSNGTDLDDFEILRANYLTGATFEQGDANLDGTVDHEDFFMWRTDYLMLGGDPALINFQAIPEPSTLSLVALAVIGTLRRARHR
ncbi:PEP-CTERM sorting domain-containing protein [Botrimarina mediterranea]|uniref:Ice-binding protein C-terminal domain-containing protein n=1 Tax=Botrimarina mediterranea TaxID=2528022 RepID=A0A518K297_9BACT|nr:PEP-CTERM sorting domain-containing protein [Botrimarina mediterranea]QDV71936.1 hypothetical protein Spa11_01050 [Botrimarina mediterranea]QDV76477.1 hypothetical protein K2D_00550 [Planctomycetes bacterium K2D]